MVPVAIRVLPLAPSRINASFNGQNSSVQREISDGPGTRTPNLVIKSSVNPVFDGLLFY